MRRMNEWYVSRTKHITFLRLQVRIFFTEYALDGGSAAFGGSSSGSKPTTIFFTTFPSLQQLELFLVLSVLVRNALSLLPHPPL